MATPNTPESNKYKYGSTTGVDLTAPIILNINPLDIESIGGHPPGYTFLKWNFFYDFITQARTLFNFDPKDTKINSTQYYHELTKTLIDKFNTDKENSKWAKLGTQFPHTGTNNSLTQKDIEAVQKFNRKTDTNIIVDGWLGTQTLQLKYPEIIYLAGGGIENIPLDISKYLIAVAWGDKRFVIFNTDYYDKNKIDKTSYFSLYDPTIHTIDKFQIYNLNTLNKHPAGKVDPLGWGPWRDLGPSVLLTPSAEQINSQTVKTQANTSNKANQTSIIKSINK